MISAQISLLVHVVFRQSASCTCIYNYRTCRKHEQILTDEAGYQNANFTILTCSTVSHVCWSYVIEVLATSTVGVLGELKTSRSDSVIVQISR